MASGAGLLLGLQHVDPAIRVLGEAIAMPASVASAKPAAACAFDPLVAAAETGPDGRFRIQSQAVAASRDDLPAYLAVAEDAAGKGRPRDAETAYIIACRMAGQVAGADSPELAEAKYRLASHYLSVAPKLSVTEGFAEIQQRAEALFGESIDVYGMKLGIEHEKARLAVAGLSSIREAMARDGEVWFGLPRELVVAKVDEYQALAKKKKPKPKVVEVETADAPPAVVAPPTQAMGNASADFTSPGFPRTPELLTRE